MTTGLPPNSVNGTEIYRKCRQNVSKENVRLRTRINSPGWNWLWIIQSLKPLTLKLETDLYVVDLKRQTPSKQGVRNLVVEVVYPLYQGLKKTRKTPQTSLIKIETSSREHSKVSYTCECTPDQWSYNTMEKKNQKP